MEVPHHDWKVVYDWKVPCNGVVKDEPDSFLHAMQEVL
jgi:hypothetical protein